MISQDPQADFEGRRAGRGLLSKGVWFGIRAIRRGIIDFHQCPARENAGFNDDGFEL